MPLSAIANANLTAFQEDEIRRIAIALHDELGQNLALLRMKLDQTVFESPSAKQDAIALVDDTLDKLRKIVLNLRPPCLDDFGICTSLQILTEDFQKKSGVRCELKIEPREIELDSARSLEIYRITQEALTNILKHSHAKFCSVFMTLNYKTLILEIYDNGCGFDASKIKRGETLGIDSMERRTSEMNGKFEIFGRPHWGTKIRVEVPIDFLTKENS